MAMSSSASVEPASLPPNTSRGVPAIPREGECWYGCDSSSALLYDRAVIMQLWPRSSLVKLIVVDVDVLEVLEVALAVLLSLIGDLDVAAAAAASASRADSGATNGCLPCMMGSNGGFWDRNGVSAPLVLSTGTLIRFGVARSWHSRAPE